MPVQPDQPDDPEDLGLPLKANGPAYTAHQARHGVPLDYVAEKIATAIEDLHRYGRHHPAAREELMPAMYHLLVSYLGLHNMLGAANDHQLAPRLFASSTDELDTWLRLVSRQGDVLGLADADDRAGH